MAKAKPNLIDKVVGKAQRVLGEVTGRPDMVIEGEARDTGLPPEDKIVPAPPKKPR